MDRNEEALDLYVKAIRLHPEWPTAYLNLSAHLQGLGRLDESVAWALRGQTLSTDPLAGANLTGPYIEFGQYDLVRSAVADFPADHPMYALMGGFVQVLDGEFSAAADTFQNIIEGSDDPRNFLFDLVAGLALLAGDYERARDFTERGHPDFLADTELQVDRFNIADVVRYAAALLALGDNERANAFLAAALPVARSLPRVGIAGQGVRDVQILALQGKSDDALGAFREAIDAGFRGSTYSDGWPLEIDPYLTSISGLPEFRSMVDEIDDSVRLMRSNVTEAKASGNWSDLMELVDSS
jgi:tetratricopeptide (TPR) repeat protein